MLIKRKLHHLISGQLPEFVRVEYPQFVTFLEHYYKFLENQGEAHDVLLNNMDWMDIDETLDVFIPYFKNQFTYDMPSDTVIDNRRLIKYINQYYEAKGSETATEMFFRFMFNDTARVQYPGDYLLRASDGRWSRKRFIKVDTTLFQNENIFELKEKVITLYYLEYIEGAGNFVRTITTRCLDVYETSRPNIYQLQVDINPNYQFPDDISADITIASSLGNFDTHVYVQYTEDDETTTYGTISKQLTSVLNVDEPGSNFRRDDTFFVSETGIEGLYFAGDYTTVTTGSAAYVFELLQNNAIVRVVKTENTFAEQYFLEDYTLFGDYASAPTRGKIKLLSIVDSGEKFLVRKTGVIESVTILDGGSGYAVGATAVNLIGDGSGAEFRVLVSNGKITQVTVVNGGANYSEEINPSTGLPLTSLTASGSGTGAVFEVNIATGYTPVKTFTVDFNNGRSGSSTAAITFATGHIYHAPGEYVDNAGFLSDSIKIQDNDYYQPYSYVIETREQLSNWKTTYLKSSHPAGFKMFSNLLLTGDITPPEVVVQEEFAQVNVEDLPYRALEETVTTSEDVAKAISRPVTTDTVSVSDVAEVSIVYLQSLSDTVSTADFLIADVSLGKLDVVSTSDTLTQDVEKLLSDNATLEDEAILSVAIALTDNVTITDSLRQEFDQKDDVTSDLQEDVATVDVTTFNTEKTLSDTFASSDATILEIETIYTDSITTSEVTTFVTEMSFTDTITMSDTTNVDFNQQDDATSDLQEDVGLNDVTAFTFDNVIVDSQFTEDGINSIDTELGKFDEVITDDVFVKNVDFTLSDSQNTVDSLTTDTTISLSDNVSTSDSLDVLIVIPIELSDSVNITETVTKSKDFSFSEHLSTNTGLDIFFNQVHDDTSELSENLPLVDEVSLSVDNTSTDSISTSETFVKEISLGLTDTFTLVDAIASDFTQLDDASSDLVEEITLSDATAFDIDYLIPTDTITVSDPNVLEPQKNVSDTQTVTDAGGTIWVDSYFENGRFSASPYVAGDYVGDGYSL
jgi:hypothetical protein